MRRMKKIGCGCCCLPVILIAALEIWPFCKSRDYEFEFRIFDRAPDLNQYPVIYVRDYKWPIHEMLYGYGLYYDAMRENGIGAFILTDELSGEAGMFFEGARRISFRTPWEGCAGYFGRLPAMESSNHSNVVAAIQNTVACSNAFQSIEMNALLKFQKGDPRLGSVEPYSIEVVDYIGELAGVGRVKYDLNGRGVTTEENAKKCAKEAITACAIKTVFPSLRTPRIEEEAPSREKRWFWHGRAPILCRSDVVAARTFKFYDENGRLFASLRINVEYDNPSGWNLKGYDEIYKAIFKAAFKELKASKEGCIVSGKSHYDDVVGVGVVSGLTRRAGKM